MKWANQLEDIEQLITRDQNLLFTIVSLIMILIIYLNQTFLYSPIIGATASVIFFLINTILLERAFFEGEIPFIRLVLGGLMLLLLLGVIGWATLIIYNLDVPNVSVALCILAISCSVINKLKKQRAKLEVK